MGLPQQLGNKSELKHVFQQEAAIQNKQNLNHAFCFVCLDSPQTPEYQHSLFAIFFW